MSKRVIVFLAVMAGAMWTAGPDAIHARGVAKAAERTAISDPADAEKLVKTYCITCHNDRLKSGGLVLDGVALAQAGAHPEVWEKVVRKLRAGLMPPSGSPRPERAVYDGLTVWLEGELNRAAASHPNPGASDTFHRLDRAEYKNAVRDVLGVDADVASMLPADDASYGFDNIAGVLRMSPTLMERYLAAAQKIAAIAIASPHRDALVQMFHVPDDLLQENHVEGLPLGTRGGIRVQYTAPASGTYEIKARLQRNGNDYVPTFPDDHTLEIAVNGSVWSCLRCVPRFRRPALLRNGPSRTRQPLTPTRRRRARRPPIDPRFWRGRKTGRRSMRRGGCECRCRPGRTTSPPRSSSRSPPSATAPVVPSFGRSASGRPESREPFRISGASRWPDRPNPAPAMDSASRRLIFTCRPARAADEPACARTILSALAERAFRRPVGDADLAPLIDCFSQARSEGGFDEGIEFAIERLLVSPQFLFRVEHPVSAAASAAATRVSDLELASRLSFFLWSSVPDREILALASANRLHDPATLDNQVRRMLADPRSDAFITNFAGQWLYLRMSRTSRQPAGYFRTSMRRCAVSSAAKRNCSSRASSVKTAPSSIS